MVILDVYGRIEKTLISKKLQLYVANLPNEKNNRWNEYLLQMINKEIKQQELDRLEFERAYGKRLDAYDLDYMKQIYDVNFYFCIIDENAEIEKYLQCFANNMIYFLIGQLIALMVFYAKKTMLKK